MCKQRLHITTTMDTEKYYSMGATYLGKFIQVTETGSYKMYRFTGATIFRPKESNGSEFRVD
jgi:hypothetical protein